VPSVRAFSPIHSYIERLTNYERNLKTKGIIAHCPGRSRRLLFGLPARRNGIACISGLRSAFGSGNGIKPLYAYETLEIGVRGVNCAAVLDGNRCKLSVSDQVSGAARAIKQLANSVPMILIGRKHTDIRLGRPGAHLPESRQPGKMDWRRL